MSVNKTKKCVAHIIAELKALEAIWEKAEEPVYNTIESAMAFDIQYLLQQLH